MKIVVCVKRVPDTETRVRIVPGGRSVDTAGVKFVMSPYDEYALEASLRTREAVGGEVTVMTLGDESCKETLRGALAMGADRAVLLRGEVGQDGLATAKALHSELLGSETDLLLMGVKAADYDQEQVGPMVATLLGQPCATAVSSFTVDPEGLTCEREVGGGLQSVRLPFPSVLTITKGGFAPRHASLKGIMAAKKKPMEVKEANVVAPSVHLEGLELPSERGAGRILGAGVEAVPELVRLLREEARVV